MALETTKSSAPQLLSGRGILPTELELGRVTGIFGVSGEVRLFLHNPATALLEPPGREVVLIAPDGARHSAWVATRPGAGKRILGRISGVTDREQARALMGWLIAVPEAELPELDANEFYVSQVEGLPAWVGERRLGRVAAVHHTGGVDILEVSSPEGPVFVPCLKELVVKMGPERVELAPEALE